MERRFLEPQLQAILSKMRLAQADDDGLPSIMEWVAKGGDIEMLDSGYRALYEAELGIMDLIVQLSTEPDHYRLESDRNDPWIEVCIKPDIDNTVQGQFGNVQQAIKYIEGLSQSQQMNKQFVITKCRSGKYTSIENLGTLIVPVEVSE